jgi:hypothetical protein
MKKILFLLLFTTVSFAQTKTINRTGEKTILSKSSVSLGNVDNTSDANKPVSTATQTALGLKAPLASPTFTGTVAGITKTMVGLANVDNTSDVSKPLSTATSTAITSASIIDRARINHTGTQDASTVLSSVNYDGSIIVPAKDVSIITTNLYTDVNTKINLKSPLASPTFTGMPILPTGTIGITQPIGDNSTALATTAFVSAATPNATTTTLGKIQLAGDLAGTAATPTVTNAAVIGKVLTGLSTVSSSDVIATDNVLVGIGKLQAQSTAIAMQIPQAASICNSFYVSPDTGVTSTTSDAGYISERVFFQYGDIDNTAGNITLNPLTGVMTAVTAGTYKINIRVMFVYSASNYTATLKNITTSATIASANHKYASTGFGNCREISIEAKATFIAGAKIALEQPGGWAVTNYNRMTAITDPIVKDLMARQYMYISFTKL